MGIPFSNRIFGRGILSLSILATLPVNVKADLLEEILVTAEKREENLQDVSVSVTAFSGDTLKDFGLGSSNDLGKFLPGVEITAVSGNQQAKTFIRGSGSVEFAANTPTTVGVYVDEVYLVDTFTHTLQTFDLERVEVLRGPQGTLYGRNATAGAINFITAKPTRELTGYAKAGYGNFNAVDLEGAVSGPLSETLAGRVAFKYAKDDGWLTGRTNFPGTVGGDDFNSTDFHSWRGTLEWAPEDDRRVLWTVFGSKDTSSSYSYQSVGAITPEDFAAGPDPVTFSFPANCDATRRNDCVNAFGYQDPDGVEGRTGDPRRGDFDLEDDLDYETRGSILRAEWDLDGFSVTSVTGWVKFDRFAPADDDGSPNLISHNFYQHESEAWSQELRLTSNSDGPLDWLVGFYYAEDEIESENVYDFLGFITTQEFEQDQESLAVFGNLGYQINDAFKVTAGLRYTRDEVTLDHLSNVNDTAFGSGINGFPGTFDPGTRGDDSFTDLGWKIGLDYTPNEDWLIYATIGTGYKSGGVGVGFGSPAEFNVYDEETLVAYEAGFKSTLWGGRARLNVSAFFYDYDDLQVFDVGPGPFGRALFISNAPGADFKGAEVELLVNPATGLDVMLGVSYLDTEFDSFLRPLTGEDLTGNSNPYAPQWKVTGLARYEWDTPVLAEGKMAAAFNWSWTDEVYHGIENLSALRAEDHWILGARLSWYSQDENVEVALWSKNLEDEYFRKQTFNFSSQGSYTAVPNTPRTYGIELIYKW